MEWPSKFPDVADRAGIGPAWQTCAPTSCPAIDVASASADVSARMKQNSNERDSAVFKFWRYLNELSHTFSDVCYRVIGK